MAGAERGALAGVGVLITRPAAQADALAALVEQAGGHAIRFPTVAITAPQDPASLNAALEELAHTDFAIFVSANAVTRTLETLAARATRWPATVRTLAVGRATAAALRSAGIADIGVPQTRHDSEGLLALPELHDVAGKRVVIFRGEDGRELLATALRARGAKVTEAQCYRRVQPSADIDAFIARLYANDIDVVTATSVETLTNLLAMIPASEHRRVLGLPLVVISARVAEAARGLGFTQQPLITREPSDSAILEAIVSWRQQATSR